ncbi:hypothetical protein HPP_1650 [Hydrangea phyllody phytoplasma]|uniref:Uncharacterized protein n=2 Tax=16SrI (Aster yellows group) TaxID=3042590 RepID=A0ABQ5PTM7_9MOLU|nr:hypothetical protein [Hydrangea phyllody phytoplasma]GFZ75207.1 hypothetical protein HPP_1650 [Hydrangea phyllody phytoplasma]GLH61422.1 hypothetical protein RHYP_3680 [Rhus yellows phytoplasma]GLH61757.1 hypothetical protein HP2P_1640 [Hydrangea phyllody phytoplasma]
MNKLLNIFLFIVGFLVGAVCGANLYVTASNNEPKYFAQTTVNQGVNGINNILGTEWESPTGKPSSSEEFLHWWLEFINGFNKIG